jgi:hypothetical protein
LVHSTSVLPSGDIFSRHAVSGTSNCVSVSFQPLAAGTLTATKPLALSPLGVVPPASSSHALSIYPSPIQCDADAVATCASTSTQPLRPGQPRQSALMLADSTRACRWYTHCRDASPTHVPLTARCRPACHDQFSSRTHALSPAAAHHQHAKMALHSGRSQSFTDSLITLQRGLAEEGAGGARPAPASCQRRGLQMQYACSCRSTQIEMSDLTHFS